MTINTKMDLGRRQFLKTAGALAGAAVTTPFVGTRAFAYKKPIELVHWSWLAASDGEVWAEARAQAERATAELLAKE